MEFLTTLGLSDSNRNKEVSKSEKTCCFSKAISKHIHLKFAWHDERGIQSVIPHTFPSDIHVIHIAYHRHVYYGSLLQVK